MYKYVTDQAYLSAVRQVCGGLMQELCHQLKEDYDIGSNFWLIGSGKRKLITQNANEGCDLDYNLEIIYCDDFDNCREIKECVRKAFNIVLRRNGWSDCQDSTSALTTEKRCFNKGNRTPFSIDAAIVCRDEDGSLYRLIHDKTGYSAMDRYHWDKVANSRNVDKKADEIKDAGKWEMVRAQYLNLKNNYLSFSYMGIRNHKPSFVCYIEAVNNVHNTLVNQRTNTLGYQPIVLKKLPDHI